VSGLFEDQAGDVFSGWIRLHDEDGLLMGLQDREKRIFPTQQHLVVEMVVDPGLQEPFDVTKVE